MPLIAMENKAMKPHFVFKLIMTKQCNQQCKYCTVDCKSGSISKHSLDNFISFLKKTREQTEKIIINFSGGEPLLQLNKIVYFIEKTQKLDLIYSIVTNATLLDKKTFSFLNKNNVDISLYFDYTSEKKLTKLSSWLTEDDLSNITATLAIVPDHIGIYPQIFKKACRAGIKNFVILPTDITTGWNKKSLKELEALINHLALTKKINLNFPSFHKTALGLNEYVINCNGEIFTNYESALWMFEQSKYVDKNLRKRIHTERLLDNIKNYKKLDLFDLEKKHTSHALHNYLVEIAKKSGQFQTVSTLVKILEQAQNKENQFACSAVTRGVEIELTNICGLRCKPCGRKRLKNLGFMDLTTLKKTISFIKETGPKEIMLAGLGDVFLHPQLFKMIDYCLKEIPGIDIVIPTKAQSINAKILKKIKKRQRQGFSITPCFSIFSLKKETYKSLTGANLNHLLDILKEAIKFKINYTFEFLLMKDNINELEDFKNFAKSLNIDECGLSLVHNWNGSMQSKGHKRFFSEKINKNLTPREKNQLCEVFQHPYLFFDYKGDISLCSIDIKKDSRLGSVFKDDLKTVLKTKNKLNYKKVCGKCFYHKYKGF